MKMFSKFIGLYKKELKIFFSQPIAYVLIVVFMAISGYFFASIANYYSEVSLRSMNSYQQNMMDLTTLDGIFRPWFFNISFILLLVLPLITMRTFAEEKREGTMELLFTFPVSDAAVVAAKFCGAYTVFLAMLTGAMSSVITLKLSANFDMAPVIGGFFGLMLLGGAFIMLGTFISGLTDSQIVAAVITFAVLLFIWIIDWLSAVVDPALGRVLSNLSVIRHYDSFSKGVIDTADLAYYGVFMFIFYFLSLRVLESKQWRG
ncbi:MAG: ABC transporter permease [Candidatus Goldiibacteriota bacterium HGW-Goldbacteria-1]|jgi:ABC-2 type transport system permease protein|nr:MAG: ABC transporter permease [Candidatus Goldiibacteriota bacterium HGW-Goldbacteria-1]